VLQLLEDPKQETPALPQHRSSGLYNTSEALVKTGKRIQIVKKREELRET